MSTEARTCTCHPDDQPPVCQRRYAASECQKAYWIAVGEEMARGKTVTDDLAKLVDEHASAWRKAGIAKSGLVFDPMDQVLLAEAREASATLKAEIGRLQRDLSRLLDTAKPGGSNVCITCAAHVKVITEDLEPEIGRLRLALEEAVDWLKDTDTDGTQARLARWRGVLGVPADDA